MEAVRVCRLRGGMGGAYPVRRIAERLGIKARSDGIRNKVSLHSAAVDVAARERYNR